jgi:hypothetical protein
MGFKGFSQDMKPKLNQLSLYTLQDKLFKTVIKQEEPKKKIVEKKPADNTNQMDLF